MQLTNAEGPELRERDRTEEKGDFSKETKGWMSMLYKTGDSDTGLQYR